jgi:hypothetical protein
VGYGSGGATGHAVAYDIATGATATAVIQGGAGSLVNTSTSLFAASSDKQQQLATSATSATGTTVDYGNVAKVTRKLWLKTSRN